MQILSCCSSEQDARHQILILADLPVLGFPSQHSPLDLPQGIFIHSKLLAPTGALIVMMVYYISIHPGDFLAVQNSSLGDIVTHSLSH